MLKEYFFWGGFIAVLIGVIVSLVVVKRAS